MFEWLTEFVTSGPLTYLVVFAVCAGDVLLPVLPSETVVITASVLAGQGDLYIFVIVPAAMLGAFAGDNVSFALGRSVGEPVTRVLFRGERGERRLTWATRALRRRGPLFVIVGRFIPGGRTASTFAAGTLGMPYARFAIADASAAALWAVYAAMLGYLGGNQFQESLWKPLLIGFGLAATVTLAGEIYRRLQARRGKDLFGDELASDPRARRRPGSAHEVGT